MLGKTMEVTYYHHSGFSCAMGDIMLVFDYWQGEKSWLPREKRLTAEQLKAYRRVYVFVSHSHPDHLDPVIYEWGKELPITYVVGDDLPPECEGVRVTPGDSLRFGDELNVEVYDSTDLGVSFLVEIGGVKIFHAGDLNLWHWREESTIQEIEEAERAFQTACNEIVGEAIDLAFFPVDPRQGRLYEAGANYFILTVKPRLLVPMHFWSRAEIALEFARHARSRQTEVIALTRIGEKMRIDFDDEGYMTVNLLYAPETVPATDVDLDAYEREDPFMHTDMPVDIE